MVTNFGGSRDYLPYCYSRIIVMAQALRYWFGWRPQFKLVRFLQNTELSDFPTLNWHGVYPDSKILGTQWRSNVRTCRRRQTPRGEMTGGFEEYIICKKAPPRTSAKL